MGFTNHPRRKPYRTGMIARSFGRLPQLARPIGLGVGLSMVIVAASGCSQLKPKGITKNTSAVAGQAQSEVPVVEGFPRQQCAPSQLSPVALRRLSAAEYQGALNALIGKTEAWPLTTDPKTAGFDHIWTDITVSKNHAGDFLGYATAAAKAIIAGPLQAPLANCGTDDSCLGTLRTETLTRILRRPLSAVQQTRYDALYAKGFAKDQSPADGFNTMIAAALFSPHFLYRTELGADSSGSGSSSREVTLTPYEIADQLAFSLTGSPPDEALLRLAANGQLNSATVRQEQADRLLNSSRGSFFSQTFARRWLQLSHSPVLGQDAAYHKSATEEVRRFSHGLLQSGGFARDWLTSQTTEVDATLAAAYQVNPSGSGEWRRVTDAKRTGILSSAAFTMTHSNQAGSAPIRRGLVIAKNVLCKTLPPPPPGIMNEEDRKPKTSATKTTRQIAEEHVRNEKCASCHTHFDGLGFALENYDGAGRYRSKENGLPIDSNISYLKGNNQTVSVGSTPELMAVMADEPAYYSCVQHNLDTYFSGTDQLSGACLVPDEQMTKWQTRTFKVRILDIIGSDQFIKRRR